MESSTKRSAISLYAVHKQRHTYLLTYAVFKARSLWSYMICIGLLQLKVIAAVLTPHMTSELAINITHTVMWSSWRNYPQWRHYRLSVMLSPLVICKKIILFHSPDGKRPSETETVFRSEKSAWARDETQCSDLHFARFTTNRRVNLSLAIYIRRWHWSADNRPIPNIGQ